MSGPEAEQDPFKTSFERIVVTASQAHAGAADSRRETFRTTHEPNNMTGRNELQREFQALAAQDAEQRNTQQVTTE